MSYCAGWKYKDSIYLWASTCAAKPLVDRRQTPSLGELLTEAEQDRIEAASLKLVPIGPGTAVACTGDAALTQKVVAHLKAQHGGAAGGAELLASLGAALGPFSAEQPVALLLASSGSDGSTELLRWSTTDGLAAEVSDFHQIGEPTPYHEALSPDLMTAMGRGELAPDLVLAIIGAIVQARGVRDVAIDLHADGLIVGLRTGQGAVTWQDDTLTVLYDKAFAISNHVTALARDDAIVVHSSVTDDTRLFAPSESNPLGRPTDAQWVRQVQDELNERRFRFRVFISTSERVITIIIRNSEEEESDFLRLSALRNGKFHLALSQAMMALLVQPTRERKEGNLPFRLSVRED